MATEFGLLLEGLASGKIAEAPRLGPRLRGLDAYVEAELLNGFEVRRLAGLDVIEP